MSFTLVATVLGWAGTVALLLSYALVSTRRLSGAGRTFQLLNVGGAAGLAVAAVEGGVWPAVALNVVWVAIGAAALARLARRQETELVRADGSEDGEGHDGHDDSAVRRARGHDSPLTPVGSGGER